LAGRDGFALDAGRGARLDAVRKILDGEGVAAPEHEKRGARSDGATPQAAGVLPFDATWFGETRRVGLAKFFPAAYGDRVLVASWNGVSMVRTSGARVWASPSDHPPSGFSTIRPIAGGRGALFAPAVLADVEGRPAVVVVREPVMQGGERYVARGINAADGKTLWSTAALVPRADLSYAGLQAVAGRYVYGVAVRRTNASAADVLLTALDVMTGETLWTATLGSVAEQGAQAVGGRKNIRPEPLDLGAFAELSEPAVAGDLVIVSPNCGATIAVGRFDGRVRWVSIYRAAEAPVPADFRGIRGRGARVADDGELPVVSRLRYRSTPVVCGDVVLVMPQDAVPIFAFDRAGGRRLWDSDLQTTEAFGLAGASGNMAVLCGTTLTGLDAGGTGKRRWRYVPPHDAPLTGPAVVVGRTVVAPTAGGLIQLDVQDGKPRTTHAVVSFKEVMETAGGRAVVDAAGAGKAFGAEER
jgi:outer membrane protein assembly factor BamB